MRNTLLQLCAVCKMGKIPSPRWQRLHISLDTGVSTRTWQEFLGGRTWLRQVYQSHSVQLGEWNILAAKTNFAQVIWANRFVIFLDTCPFTEGIFSWVSFWFWKHVLARVMAGSCVGRGRHRFQQTIPQAWHCWRCEPGVAQSCVSVRHMKRRRTKAASGRTRTPRRRSLRKTFGFLVCS